MAFFESPKLVWGGIGLCLWSTLFIYGCAVRQEAVDLKPHVNKVILRINELTNRAFDLENRLKSLENQQTQVPDHIRRLADLEAKLGHLEEEARSHFTAEQENVNLWKNFDQKLQNFRRELENQQKNFQQLQDDTRKKIEALSPGPNQLICQGEEKSTDVTIIPGPSVKVTEKAAYEDAYQTFVQGDVLGARKKFQIFLLLYPDSDLADNAQFWIGESFYNQKEYERAIIEYEKVIQNYSQGGKVPSALLKQGFAFYALGQIKESKILFEQVMRKAPQSEQARIAKKKLESITKAK